MAMSLSSCTSTTLLMSRAAAAPGKSSPGAGSLQLRRSRQPAPARWSSSSRRPSLFACHALKYEYQIESTALVYPPSTTSGTNWQIGEDKEKDLIFLELEVGDDLPQEKLQVSTTEHMLLVVKYDGKINDELRASSLDVRLLMPPGYDENNVKAMMVRKGCWLRITIPKPKHKPNTIHISPLSSTSTTTMT